MTSFAGEPASEAVQLLDHRGRVGFGLVISVTEHVLGVLRVTRETPKNAQIGLKSPSHRLDS
jgi:hypothetical protein